MDQTACTVQLVSPAQRSVPGAFVAVPSLNGFLTNWWITAVIVSPPVASGTRGLYVKSVRQLPLPASIPFLSHDFWAFFATRSTDKVVFVLFRNGFRKSTLDMTHPAVKTGYVPNGTFRLPPAPEQPTSETLTRTPKSFRLVNVVDGVVTVTGPLVVLAATVAVICLSESTVNVDAAAVERNRRRVHEP